MSYQPRSSQDLRRSIRGYTIFELIVTMAIAGIMGALAMAALRSYVRHSDNAGAMIQGFVKQVRAKAIARTAAYRITASSLDGLSTSFADRCSDTSFTPDPTLSLDLPPNTRFTSMGWSLCMNTRGLSNSTHMLVIEGDGGERSPIEVMLGGATRRL